TVSLLPTTVHSLPTRRSSDLRRDPEVGVQECFPDERDGRCGQEQGKEEDRTDHGTDLLMSCCPGAEHHCQRGLGGPAQHCQRQGDEQPVARVAVRCQILPVGRTGPEGIAQPVPVGETEVGHDHDRCQAEQAEEQKGGGGPEESGPPRRVVAAHTRPSMLSANSSGVTSPRKSNCRLVSIVSAASGEIAWSQDWVKVEASETSSCV